MQDGRGMLELAVLADRRRLAVTFRTRPVDSERGDRAAGQQLAEFLPDLDQRREVLDIAARERVLDHRDGGGAPRRRLHRTTHFKARLLDDGHDLANFRLHLRPSNPLISDAFSPPARLCTRAPVVIARTSSISSARGASAIPTSIASKWLRT